MSDSAVVCYGELGVDNVVQVPRLPTPEQAVFPTSDTYHVGGAAANTAIWLARWGVATRLAGNAIGDDELGRRLVEWLGAHPALDASSLRVVRDGSTPFCRILVTPDAERTILIFGYADTPKTPLSPKMLEAASFLVLDLYGGDERVDAARTARALGVPTVVSDVISEDHPVLSLADVVINSAAYLRSAVPGIDVRERAGVLRERTGGIVVTTDGPRPVHAIDGTGEAFCVTPSRVRALDTTGAGDAFRAGLIYGLLQRWTLRESVGIATAAGVLKVSRLGAATDVPSIEEVAAAADGFRVDAG